MHKYLKKRLAKAGFSLIECIVYCCMLALIMTVWFSGVASFARMCTAQAQHIDTTTAAHTALDLFNRDMRKASPAIATWPVITKDGVIIQIKESEFVGWKCIKGKLVRYQGNYTSANNKWSKRAKSIVLNHVEQCSFTYNQNNQTQDRVLSVTVHLVVCGKTVTRTSYINTEQIT